MGNNLPGNGEFLIYIRATKQLKEYLDQGIRYGCKGSAIPDYFDEILVRIRDIRSSERRMYIGGETDLHLVLLIMSLHTSSVI